MKASIISKAKIIFLAPLGNESVRKQERKEMRARKRETITNCKARRV